MGTKQVTVVTPMGGVAVPLQHTVGLGQKPSSYHGNAEPGLMLLLQFSSLTCRPPVALLTGAHGKQRYC